MSKLIELPLGEFIDVKHGFAFSGKFISDEPNDFVLVTPGNFNIGGGFKSTKLKFYKGEIPEEYILSEGDCVVTMTDLSQETDTLGYSAKIPKSSSKVFLHNQRIGLIHYLSDEVDRDFIYWLLRTYDYHCFIVGSASGTSIMHTSPSRIKEYKFPFPSISVQKTIANILNSLEDKIDLLHRQNKTLEQLAETVFNLLFVDEFNGELKLRKLEDLVFFDPKERSDKQKNYQVFDMKCLSTDDMRIGEGSYRKISSATTFRNEDTILAKITPCLENGKTGFVMHLAENEIAKGSTEFIVMRTKGEVSPYWIYCLARNKDFRDSAILSMTGTSGRQRVQIDLLKSYEVNYEVGSMKSFHDTVCPLFQKIKLNQKQIFTLTKLRDSLLPKFMNGLVRVNSN
jgi:type I restriction enzyme S subunit